MNNARWRKLRTRQNEDQDTTAQPSLLPRDLVSAAAQQISAASYYRPPELAETVALLALWPKESQRPALVEALRYRELDDLPIRMLPRRRSLRKRIREVAWHNARVGTWDRDHTRPASERAQKCWAFMLIAGHTTHMILNLRCWKDTELLDDQGLRIDLGAILADIGTQMLRSAQLACELGDLPDNDGTPESAHARDAIGQQLHILDAVLDAEETRLAALTTYRARLASVDRQTEAVRRAEQAQLLSDRTEDLLGLTGRAQIDEDALTHAARSMSELAQARSSALAEIRGDYLNALTQRFQT